MEPFSPQDPLHKLLGKARSAEPRPNFTQNVLRAVRQLPQRMTYRERLAEWLSLSPGRAPVLAAACAAVLLGALTVFWMLQPSMSDQGMLAQHTADSGQKPIAAAGAVDDSTVAENDVATALNNMDQLSILLAQQDAKSMTDTEMAFLLY